MNMQLNDNVQDVLGEIIIYNQEHPYEQRLKSYTLKQNDLQQLETVLQVIIPNIIITHSQTDTEEDKVNQFNKLRSIYSMNMYPYYIDLNVRNKKLSKTRI